MDILTGLSALDILTLVLAFGLGGFIKGVVGMGLPMVAVPLISTVFDPRTAIATMILPIMGANFLQAKMGGSMVEVANRFRWLLIPLIVGSIFGATVITSVEISHAAVILGGLVATFAVTTLAGWQPQLPTGVDRRLRPVVGLVSGVVGGMSSFFAPTIAPYFFTLGLDKNTFIRAMGVTFLIGEAPLFIGLSLTGFAPPAIWLLSAAGWAVVGAFMAVGAKVRQHIPQKHFMTLVGVMLLIVGLNMIRRAVF